MKPKGTKTYTASGIELEYMGEVEISDELMEKIERMTEEADEQIAGDRINIEWLPRHVNLVHAVAAYLGVSVDDYVKQALFEKATADLARLRSWKTTPAEHPTTIPEVAERGPKYSPKTKVGKDKTVKAKKKRR